MSARTSIVPIAVTVLFGAVAALLDTTLVAVALNALQADLGASVTAVGWVSTAYILAMTAVIPLVGWSVGRFGARGVWVAALGVFLLGAVLSACAWSVGSLIAFRALQGLGGGMVLPLTQVTLARAAGPERLGRVMGVVGLFGQLAPVTGPVLGGLLVDGWGWRWAFLATAPPVLAALAMTGRWFPRETERSSRPLDVAGLVLLPGGLVALLYALSGGGVALAVLGGAMITIFGVRALRRSDALVDLRLFADPSFRGGTVMMFVLGVTTWGPMFLLPLYLQQRGGLSSLDAGLVLAPQGVGMGLAFLLVGRVADRLPPRPLAAAGMAVGTAATVPFLFTSDPVLLGTTLLARGAGFGVASLPIAAAIYRTLPKAAMAHASSASNVVQRIGAAAGTALMAAVVAAAGFEPALLVMVVLAAVALASTIVLRPTPGGPAAPPDSATGRPTDSEPHRRPRCR
ncbi:EmrB/QacA subfamily drug resistance transporter [Pseudonocardia hierapolitana]|uniref:EmrB/QacA subfamily drug resistance transporter n=1 Tax=Pseudonocardia hierapolitana TaxID=1128676 RepID=A0A561SIQ1_9PSEU|nr:DHA2 family efflux MFS transporter permease subunit [Pseudonocardia hierapolitana]TWF74756.1 EmrB/QacA subfamily drug resistance transporter [Pseudonocardia hierapolitana]